MCIRDSNWYHPKNNRFQRCSVLLFAVPKFSFSHFAGLVWWRKRASRASEGFAWFGFQNIIIQSVQFRTEFWNLRAKRGSHSDKFFKFLLIWVNLGKNVYGANLSIFKIIRSRCFQKNFRWKHRVSIGSRFQSVKYSQKQFKVGLYATVVRKIFSLHASENFKIRCFWKLLAWILIEIVQNWSGNN